jgi:hypothetical protein
MRHRPRLRLGRCAGLEHDNRLAETRRPPRQRLKGAQAAHPLDMQAKRCHARVREQRRADIGHAGLRLIADGGDIGQRQPAPLHRQVDRHVRALPDKRDAGLTRRHAVHIRPEGCAVECIDEAIAIRPQNGHGARCRHQPFLERGTVRHLCSGLAKTRGETDRAARAARRECCDHLDAGRAVHADKGRVRPLWQGVDRAVRGQAAHGNTRRMHGPYRPGKADPAAFADDALAPCATADHRNAAGPQQPVERGHLRPPAGARGRG